MYRNFLNKKINDLAEIMHKRVKLRVPNGFQNRAPHLQRARARARPCRSEFSLEARETW